MSNVVATARLDEVCNILNGFAFKSSCYVDDGIRIIRIANVQKGYIEDSSPCFYPFESEETITRYLLSEGDLLISLTGNVGRVGILESGLLPAALNQRVACLRPKPNVSLSRKYLFYKMNSYHFEEQCINASKGIAQKNLSAKWLSAYEMSLPDLATQESIVAVFDLVYGLIAHERSIICQLDQLVKSQFVEMFGDPVTNPMNLPNAKLADFCDLLNGYAFKSGNYVENSDVLNCRMSNIRPGGLFDAEYNPKYLPSDYWETYSKFQLSDGDIIIAMTDMANDPKILGVPTIVKTGGRKFLLNQRVGKLVIENPDRFNNVYLMYSLSQKHIRLKLASKAGKSMQVNVGKPAILAIQILEPPLALQQEFATFVAQVDKSRFAVRQSIEQLELLKAKLMQDYFS